MTSKLPILSALVLVACSGSSAGVDMLAGNPEEPTKFITQSSDDAGPSPKAATPQGDAGTTEEASTDSGQDAGQDAGEDASQADSGGQDAGQDADAGSVTRYGVSFSGAVDDGLYAPLSTDLIGKSSVTLEAYFRFASFDTSGLIFQTPNAYCAVTVGPATTPTIHCCAPENNLNPCVVGPAKASPGVWFHVAWVLSGGNWTLFVNGVKQGDVPSVYQGYPSFVPPVAGKPSAENNVYFGVQQFGRGFASVQGTVDEFRLTYSALYAADFTPPKHLDAAAAMNLMLDDGAGKSSGVATLYGASKWVTVTR